jgi:archaellum biogenesis ATPase FlaH
MSNQLSGQHLFNGGRFLIITGGEEDKCAAWQIMHEYTLSKGSGYESVAVVSPTCGEGSAVKQVAANFDFCDKFETIVIMMDSDKAGIEAADALAKALPSNKVKVARLPLKDPCEMLKAGMDKQLVSCFYSAKEFVDTDIKSSDGIMDDISEILTATKITLPPYMHRMEKMMKRAWSTNGRVVNILGATSCGKSSHVNNMTYHWIFHESIKPLIISLEMTSGEYAIDLLSLHLKKNLDWFEEGQEAVDYLDRPDVKELYKDLFTDEYGNERFRIVDDRDGKIETIQKQIERGVKQYGCNIIIIDVLTDILRFLPIDAQEQHMAWQKNFVKSGISIVNVLHTRKPDRDKEGKQRKTTEYDALGSGTFVQSAHINIVLNRDKMAQDDLDKNTTLVDMPKCRRGTTGEAGEWVYDVPTRQCYDKEDFLVMKYSPTNDVVMKDISGYTGDIEETDF